MKTRFSALMMTFLMLVSLSAVAVSAAIPDGDGTNGYDRNPTPPEQDVSTVSRTYDPASVKSSMEVTLIRILSEMMPWQAQLRLINCSVKVQWVGP